MHTRAVVMRASIWTLILLLAVAGTAEALQASRVRLRLGFPAPPSLAEVPVLLAGERLRVQGVDLEPLFFADSILVTQALLRGNVDVGLISLPPSMSAVHQGAALKAFATMYRNGWTIYAKRAITDCQDLAGKRVAVHSSTGMSAAIVRYWFAERCPSVPLQFIVVPGSESRAAAMIANQIDVAAIELSDALQIDRLRPGQFHRLADFAREASWLISNLYFTTPATLAGRRDVLKVFTRELIRIHRLAAADPEVISTVAAKYIRVHDPSMISAITRAYAESGIWPTDGAFTPQVIARTMRFLEASGTAKPGLTAEQMGDYTIMREVLEELGR